MNRRSKHGKIGSRNVGKVAKTPLKNVGKVAVLAKKMLEKLQFSIKMCLIWSFLTLLPQNDMIKQ